MHGPLRLTYALLANYMAKCQMTCGPYGPILAYRQAASLLGHFKLDMLGFICS